MNKFYKVTFNNCSYDQFKSFIICAKDELEAIALIKLEHPVRHNFGVVDWDGGYQVNELKKEKGIILEEFHAG